jgi:hypothetical protein
LISNFPGETHNECGKNRKEWEVKGKNKKTKPEKGNICDKTHMKRKGRKKTKSHKGSEK